MSFSGYTGIIAYVSSTKLQINMFELIWTVCFVQPYSNHQMNSAVPQSMILSRRKEHSKKNSMKNMRIITQGEHLCAPKHWQINGKTSHYRYIFMLIVMQHLTIVKRIPPTLPLTKFTIQIAGNHGHEQQANNQKSLILLHRAHINRTRWNKPYNQGDHSGKQTCTTH